MTWLLWSVAALVFVMSVCLFFGLAAASRIDLSDTDDIDDDDEPPEGTDEKTVFEFLYIYPVPPFAVRAIGPSGQHDRYPLTEAARQFWIDMLNASWELPARERTS